MVSSSILAPPSTRIPEAVMPPLPGEHHLWYGNVHMKQVKLPREMLGPTRNNSGWYRSGDGLSDDSEMDVFEAAATGNLDRLCKLLAPQNSGGETSAYMMQVNAANPATGLTALHYAASRGQEKVVKWLTDVAYVMIDLEDPTGETALHKAAYAGHHHVVAFLLQRHASVLRQDNDGWTALHNAASQGHLRVVKYLLGHTKADVNVKSRKGYTPLMNAASKGHVRIIEYLVNKSKANPFIKNMNNETAYDVAATMGETFSCEVLEKAERDWWKGKKSLPESTSFSELISLDPTQSYDVVGFHIAYPVTLHENQRATSVFPILRGPPRYSATALLRTDARGPWSLLNGKPYTKEELEEPIAALNALGFAASRSDKGWFWATDWRIDTTYPRVGTDGWQYARNFDEHEEMWLPTPPVNAGNWVRRRKWVRVLKQKSENEMGEASNSLPPPSNMLIHPYGDDYVTRAEALLSKDSGKGKSVNSVSLADQLTRYREAITILQAGIRSDVNSQRRSEASSLMSTCQQHAEFLQSQINKGEETASTTSKDVPFTSFASVLGRNDDRPHSLQKLRSGSSTSINSFQTLENVWNTSVPSDDVNGSSSTFSDISGIGPPRASPQTGLNPMTVSGSNLNNSKWENDEDVHNCRRCSRPFGLWVRRHHCRRCGKVVCNKCSTARVKLPANLVLCDPAGGSESGIHRVCDDCYKNGNYGPSSFGSQRPRSNSLTSTGMHSGGLSLYRRRRSSNSSVMTECPVCHTNMNDLPGGSQEHLKTCLENRNMVSGVKYVGEQADF